MTLCAATPRQCPKEMGIVQLFKKCSLLQRICIIGILAAMYAGCLYLFYNMSVGNMFGDINAHIKSALARSWGQTYSILSIIYKMLHTFCPNTVLIVCFLAFVAVAGVLATWVLFAYLVPEGSPWVLFVLAFLCSFVLAIYMPQIFPYRYRGTIPPSKWHNPTYLVSKVLATIALYYFLKIKNTYLEKISWKDWSIFVLVFLASTSVKAMFFISFAPAMAILLFRDLIKTKGKAINRILWFGCAVLPNVAILLYQYIILFGTGDNQIIVSFMDAMYLATDQPITGVLLSFAFPLVTTIFLWKTFRHQLAFQVNALTVLFSMLQVFFLHEMGPRAAHGNFFWAAGVALFFLFLTCAAGLYQWMRVNLKQPSVSKIRKGICVAVWGLFGFHAICGLWYFMLLLQGVPYRM